VATNITQGWEQVFGQKFVARKGHRQWLLTQADALFNFFEPHLLNPAGGFHTLDNIGLPLPPKSGHNGQERELHETSRMVHCFSLAKLIGRANADDIIDHGMSFLWSRHRDEKNGGYYWGVDDVSPTNPSKQAYGHAFVLLASVSAKMVGHPDADRLLEDISEILHSRFWEASIGAASEEYSDSWQSISDYRGQNSNMHLTEALMAAYEVTDDKNYLDMAQSIAELIINRHAREQGWQVAEHFDANWQVDLGYIGDPVFRPAGTTPGHALEWSRLLIQLWELGNRGNDWMPDAAKHLFFNAVETGWAANTGGFYYTLGWDGAPDQKDRFWWPCAEGIAAAAALGSIDDDPLFEEWYRRIWGFTDAHIIDYHNGGWFPELDSKLRPVNRIFSGKPDLYHALQACLFPLLPPQGRISQDLG